MTKLIVLILLMRAGNFNGLAQTIGYNISFNNGFDRPLTKFEEYAGYLVIHSATSVFYSVKDQKHPEPSPLTLGNIDTVWRVYKKVIGNEILVEDYLFNNLISLFYSDSLHPMQWTIHNQAKLIDTLLCVKATTKFRGRSYTAWFSKQLAAGHGPWKFGGLPGLICEVQEDQGDLSIKISSVVHQTTQIPYPTKTPKTLEEFKAMGRKFIKRLQEMQRATEDCNTCGAQTVVSFKFWENLFE